MDLARRVLYGREGTPPREEINNDGIVLALAPATRSARGIREALTVYHSVFFPIYQEMITHRMFDTPSFPCNFGPVLVHFRGHSSEGQKSERIWDTGRTGMILFRPFSFARFGVTSYASCHPINHVSPRFSSRIPLSRPPHCCKQAAFQRREAVRSVFALCCLASDLFFRCLFVERHAGSRD